MDGIEAGDFLDRRKDLAHNRLGREIGLKARRAGLWGERAERFVQHEVLDEMAA